MRAREDTHKLRKVKARPVRTMCTYGSLHAPTFFRLYGRRGSLLTSFAYARRADITRQRYTAYRGRYSFTAGFSRIKIKVHTDTVHPAPRSCCFHFSSTSFTDRHDLQSDRGPQRLQNPVQNPARIFHFNSLPLRLSSYDRLLYGFVYSIQHELYLCAYL